MANQWTAVLLPIDQVDRRQQLGGLLHPRLLVFEKLVCFGNDSAMEPANSIVQPMEDNPGIKVANVGGHVKGSRFDYRSVLP